MVWINDKFEVTWEEGMTVDRVREKLKFSFRMLVITVNGRLVPQEKWKNFPVQDGDEMKILHMTAGG